MPGAMPMDRDSSSLITSPCVTRRDHTVSPSRSARYSPCEMPLLPSVLACRNSVWLKSMMLSTSST